MAIAIAASKVVIEEQGGRRRKLELVGPGLPLRGTPFPVQQRLVTDPVPGNADDAIQQVLGPIDASSSWEGMWRTTRLAARPALYSEGGGAPQKVALAFTLYTIVDDMVRTGLLLRMAWSVGDRKIERLGRVATFTPKFDRIDDIGWELEWEWVGRGPARQSVASFRSDQNAALAKSVSLELGKIAAEINASKIIASTKGLPFTADSFSLGDLESLLDVPSQLMGAFSRTVQQLASRIDALGKLIEKAEELPANLATQAIDAATSILTACAEFDQAVSVRGPETYVTFDQSSSVQGLLKASSYFGNAQGRAETALRVASELRLAAQKAARPSAGQEGPAGSGTPDLLAVIIARQGDTFASLSARFYSGNPDLAPAIAKANKYPSYAVSPDVGALLVIPSGAVAQQASA